MDEVSSMAADCVFGDGSDMYKYFQNRQITWLVAAADRQHWEIMLNEMVAWRCSHSTDKLKSPMSAIIACRKSYSRRVF